MFLLGEEGIDVCSQAGASDELALAPGRDLLDLVSRLRGTGVALEGKRALTHSDSKRRRITLRFTAVDADTYVGEMRIPELGVHVGIAGVVDGGSLVFNETRFLSPQPAGGGWNIGDTYRLSIRNSGKTLGGFWNEKGSGRDGGSPVAFSLMESPVLKPGLVQIGKRAEDGAITVTLGSIEVLPDLRLKIHARWTNNSSSSMTPTISGNGGTHILDSDGERHDPIAWGDNTAERTLGRGIELSAKTSIDVWALFSPLGDVSGTFEYVDGKARFPGLTLRLLASSDRTQGQSEPKSPKEGPVAVPERKIGSDEGLRGQWVVDVYYGPMGSAAADLVFEMDLGDSIGDLTGSYRGTFRDLGQGGESGKIASVRLSPGDKLSFSKRYADRIVEYRGSREPGQAAFRGTWSLPSREGSFVMRRK